jgi:hypothetical protein
VAETGPNKVARQGEAYLRTESLSKIYAARAGRFISAVYFCA